MPVPSMSVSVSVSVTIETNPWSPIENFGRTTVSPAADTRSVSTAQSSREKQTIDPPSYVTPTW